MNLNTARAICHPGPQDQTLALADDLIGAENQLIAKQEAQANVDGTFRSASYTLETAAINLRAYSRGMVSKETLPTYIRKAREALDAMESAL